MRRQIKIFLLALSVLFLASCSRLEKEEYQYRVPEQIRDGWQTVHVSKVNLDEKPLAELIQNILNEKYKDIHSILIVKNGKLVLEEYFKGKDYKKSEKAFIRDDMHQIMSVTKSFASTLIGIAVDKGMIKDTEEDLVSFFPEYRKLLGENGKKIKLKHILSMTAGFDWDETTYLYSDSRNPYWIMLGPERRNIIKYILSRPIKEKPGDKFVYNGGLSILLGKIIEKRSQLKVRSFAERFLFGPLGIKNFEWGYWDEKEKVPRTDAGLNLRPRDMAKLGYLYANKGKWKGKQIISTKWVEAATKMRIEIVRHPLYLVGYGYQWWLYSYKQKEIFVAMGWGGQRIIVIPDQNMVIVFTAGNYSMPHQQVVEMMSGMVKDYILPAVLKN